MKVAERYAEYEQETFKIVTDARSKATSIQIDPSNITPEQLTQFKEAQSTMTSALSRLLITLYLSRISPFNKLLSKLGNA